jgi:radical SAM superfamily enzyme YgiQ (UPF0313 family)
LTPDTLLIFPRFKHSSGDPPLGVAYLASCLREGGHSVDVFDATFEQRPLDALAARLRERRPRLVAISALISMVGDVAATAQVVKRVSPETLVIVGGPHATVEPESTAALEGVDAVHVGEAEVSLPALAAADLDFRGIPGFAWREGSEFHRTGCGTPVDDLDDIPYPAWDLLPMGRYLGVWYQLDSLAPGLTGTSIIASRGCPFDCAYCQPTLRTIFGSAIRRRSPANIIGELAELKGRFAIDGVMWLDDTFLVAPRWMAGFCGELRAANLGLLWGCNARADKVDRDSLVAMRDAGLRVIHIGIESATQRILDDVYQKGITVEQVRDAVHMAHELGLKVRGYFMLGAPTETEQEAWDTVHLACTLPLHEATFSIATPLPHTHLWDRTRDLVGRELSEFDYYKTPVYRSEQVIAPERLVHIKRTAYLRFYLGRPRLWQTVRSVFSPSGIRKMLVKVTRF